MARFSYVSQERKGRAMMISELGEKTCKHLGFRSYSLRTIDAYKAIYAEFVAYVKVKRRLPDDLKHFTGPVVLDFAEDMKARGLAAASIVKYLSALATMAKFGMKLQDERTGRPVLDSDPTSRFDWPQVRSPETKFLLRAEARAFLEADVSAFMRLARDILMETGIRATELCQARVGDLREDGGAFYLSVTVKGRRASKRTVDVPISPGLWRFIWRELEAAYRIRHEDPLIVGANGKAVNRTQLTAMIYRIGLKAGITRFPVSAHKIRHTANVIAKYAGLDSHTRSRLLNHSDPSSLARYDHVLPGELHAARAKQMEALERYTGADQEPFGHTSEMPPGLPPQDRQNA